MGEEYMQLSRFRKSKVRDQEFKMFATPMAGTGAYS
jgi:hypothetical protein